MRSARAMRSILSRRPVGDSERGVRCFAVTARLASALDDHAACVLASGTQSERLCINDLTPAPELRTCAGSIRPSGDFTVKTCTYATRITSFVLTWTMSVVTSDDGRVIRDRAAQKSEIAGGAHGALASIDDEV